MRGAVLWVSCLALVPATAVADQLITVEVRECDRPKVIERLLSKLEHGQAIETTDDWRACPVATVWPVEAIGDEPRIIDTDGDGLMDQHYQLWRRTRPNGTSVLFIVRSVLVLRDRATEANI